MSRLAGPKAGEQFVAGNQPQTEIVLSDFSFNASASVDTAVTTPSALFDAMKSLPGSAQALLLRVSQGAVVPDALSRIQAVCPENQAKLSMECLVLARAAANQAPFERVLLSRLSPSNLPSSGIQSA